MRTIRPKLGCRTILVLLVLGGLVLAGGPEARAGAAPASTSTRASTSVTWMRGYAAPGTPARYNQVGVLKIGPARARNVLVLEPGTSAGSAYFVPLAKWVVSRAPGWQVWSVERRENLLEDQSVLNSFKRASVESDPALRLLPGLPEGPVASLPLPGRSRTPASSSPSSGG